MFTEDNTCFVKMHSNIEEWKVEFGTKTNRSKGGVLNAWM